MTNDKELFDSEIKSLLRDPRIRDLRKYSQHFGSNTLRHSLLVARASFNLAEKLGWKISEKELARGALLHDFYLYSTKDKEMSAFRHGTTHPMRAIRNADPYFGLTDKEKDIIQGHMWPLTLFHRPHSKEALLVCMADKQIATMEMAKGALNYFAEDEP